jgi:membrane associated rhomboid family serine protease
MTHPDDSSPFNPLPPVVVLLFLAVVIPEIAFFLGSKGLIGGPQAVGWRQAMIQDYGFSGDLLRWMIANGIYPPEHLLRIVTYPFLHGGFSEMLFAAALLLAMGKFVGEVFRPVATLAAFFIPAICGALAYGLIAQDNPWLYGAFPGIYGLIGAFTYLLWLKLGQTGGSQSRAFVLIGFLMGAQLLFSLMFGGTLRWVADGTGFLTCFIASFVLRPGGWTKLRMKLLQR